MEVIVLRLTHTQNMINTGQRAGSDRRYNALTVSAKQQVSIWGGGWLRKGQYCAFGCRGKYTVTPNRSLYRHTHKTLQTPVSERAMIGVIALPRCLQDNKLVHRGMALGGTVLCV